MNKTIKKLLSLFIAITVTLSLSITNYAAEQSILVAKIESLVKKAEKEIDQYGEASDATIAKLNSALDELGIEQGSYSDNQLIVVNDSITPYGYGETHTLKRGWTYRVDKPSTSDAKPHVHVDNNKKGIHGVENVDGTPSHGKTLGNSNVPKDVQDEVQKSRDYKKGQSDLNKMRKAKSEISRRHINLKKYKGRIIAAGIFVVIVGVAFFSPAFLPTALGLI